MNQNPPSVRAAEQEGANARASRRDESYAPWNAPLLPINACTPRVAKGAWYRLPLVIDTKLLLHCLQLRLSLNDLTMDHYIHEWSLCQCFADLEGSKRMSDESTILLLSHPRKAHLLGDQTLVTTNAMLSAKAFLLEPDRVANADLIGAANSTKSRASIRYSEIHQTKKGSQYCQRMIAPPRLDAEAGLVHKVDATAAKAHDVTQAHTLHHCEGMDVLADSGFRHVKKCNETHIQHLRANLCVGVILGKRQVLDTHTQMGVNPEKIEQTEASIRMTSEHQIQFMMRQFGIAKVLWADQEPVESGDAICAVDLVDSARVVDEFAGDVGMTTLESLQRLRQIDRSDRSCAENAPCLPIDLQRKSSTKNPTEKPTFVMVVQMFLSLFEFQPPTILWIRLTGDHFDTFCF